MRAVNLIPAEQRGGAPVGIGRSEGVAYGVIAVLAGLAVLALLYGQARHQVSSRSGQAASLAKQAQQAQAQASQLAPYTSFIALREQRTHAVAQLVDSRFDWAHVFHEFGRVLPPSTSISSLVGTVGSVTTSSASASAASAASSATVASATPPGTVPSFTLIGCAANQAAVALTLERLRLIDGVSNVTLQSSTAQATSPGAASSTTSGGCPASDPVFNIQVTFEALPQPSAITSSTATAANSNGVVR